MKRIILLFVGMVALVYSISAQNSDLQKWVNKAGKGQNATSQPSTSHSSSQMNEINRLMEKSTKFQCGAVTFAGVGAGLSIIGAIIGTKDYQDQDLTMDEMKDKVDSDRKLRKGLFIGAGASFAVALCMEIVALDYKLKAGKSLRVFSNGTGGGLAYTF